MLGAAVTGTAPLTVTAPSMVRDKLRGLSARELVDALARSRPTGELDDPTCAVKMALRQLARRYQRLDKEIKDAEKRSGRWSPGPPRGWSPCPASAPRPPNSY
ncbi:hypothetical protein ACFC5Z_14795 [Streptomyces sp. NPDC056004]|uniref:hypothetical protein n=1 Tax=Streptomyces sp. NPDC056004 TaxID=3345677 RepID=UPI0035DF1BA2